MISLDGHSLDIGTLIKASRKKEPVELSQKAIQSIEQSQQRLNAIIAQGKPVYGLNTGIRHFCRPFHHS
jgi:Histidine ammonia-lyase